MREDAVPVEMAILEALMAALVGSCRRTSSWKNGLNHQKHTPKSNWATDVDGALAEMATAKWLGVYYEPRNMDFKGPDVGRQVQTRSTTHADGHLIFRDNDKVLQVQPFVLCVTDKWIVWLVGWLHGNKCMRPEWRNVDRWEVPQEKLEPMDRFPFTRQKSLFSA